MRMGETLNKIERNNPSPSCGSHHVMTFHTVSSVSSCAPSSFPGHLTGRRRVPGCCSKHSVKLRPNVRCRRTLFCTALLEEDIKTWRSAVQQYYSAIPYLAANRGASEVAKLSRVLHFMAQFLRLQSRGLSTVMTALLLANAFYSDIAPPNDVDTFQNVPKELTLSGGDKPRRIQRPKSKKAEGCTQKCLGTCIRGGAGSPGEGPFNVRRPLVVFKEGFRSRQYCLIECSEICNIIGDGDDGP